MRGWLDAWSTRPRPIAPGKTVGGKRRLLQNAGGALARTCRARTPRVERAVQETLESRRLLSGYTLSVLANFDMASGINPQGGVIMDPAGNLYGTTGAGGGLGNGTVFELPQGASVITALDSFNATNTGSNAQGNLIMDAGGNLYGTTAGGGSNNVGTVFELAKSNDRIATLVNFNTSDGASPFGGLIADSAGNLYGTTVSGGSAFDGTAFEVAQGSGTVTTLVSVADSKGLVSQLIMDSVGNLYGTATQGGVNAVGSIFELARGSSAFTTLASFNTTHGATPGNRANRRCRG